MLPSEGIHHGHSSLYATGKCAELRGAEDDASFEEKRHKDDEDRSFIKLSQDVGEFQLAFSQLYSRD